MNKIIDASKLHYHKYANMKKENMELVKLLSNGIPALDRVFLKIKYFCSDKRTDPDNLVVAKKFILDGLVKSKVLKNDGWKQVAGFKETWDIDKKNPRIEVTLFPVKE